jgi:hypothetical protein
MKKSSMPAAGSLIAPSERIVLTMVDIPQFSKAYGGKQASRGLAA